MQIRVGVFSCVVIQLLLGIPAGAQVSVSLGPSAGYYRPFGHFEPASIYSTNLPRTPQDLSGFALGAVADVWVGVHFGAEVEGSVAHSTIPEVVTPDGPRGPTSAQVQVLLMQALVAVPQDLNGRTWVSAGLGVIRHGGAAYSSYGSPSQGAGVVGAGGAFKVGDRFSIRVGLTALLYMLDVAMPAGLQQNAGSIERGRQTDVTFRLGGMWTIVGPRY